MVMRLIVMVLLVVIGFNALALNPPNRKKALKKEKKMQQRIEKQRKQDQILG